MNEPEINQVSDTAFMTAAYGGMETERPNSILDVEREALVRRIQCQ